MIWIRTLVALALAFSPEFQTAPPRATQTCGGLRAGVWEATTLNNAKVTGDAPQDLSYVNLISRGGCQFEATVTSVDGRTSMVLVVDPTKSESLTLWRTLRNCRAGMFGKIAGDNSTLRWELTRTDGMCNLEKTYREVRTFRRADCGWMAGAWEQFELNELSKTDPAKLVVTGVTPACTFNATFDGTTKNAITGEVPGTITLVRQDAKGCKSTLNGRLEMFGRTRLKWTVAGGDGACGVSRNYTETRTFRRPAAAPK